MTVKTVIFFASILSFGVSAFLSAKNSVAREYPPKSTWDRPDYDTREFWLKVLSIISIIAFLFSNSYTFFESKASFLTTMLVYYLGVSIATTRWYCKAKSSDPNNNMSTSDPQQRSDNYFSTISSRHVKILYLFSFSVVLFISSKIFALYKLAKLSDSAFYSGLVITGISLVLYFINWRCPHCKKRLKLNPDNRTCAHCNVAIRK